MTSKTKILKVILIIITCAMVIFFIPTISQQKKNKSQDKTQDNISQQKKNKSQEKTQDNHFQAEVLRVEDSQLTVHPLEDLTAEEVLVYLDVDVTIDSIAVGDFVVIEYNDIEETLPPRITAVSIKKTEKE